MTLLITRLILTVVIVVVGYFALQKVWTNQIDIAAIFKTPSDIIPVIGSSKSNDARKTVERPWITVETIEFLDGRVRVGTPLRAQIKLKNTGSTPARNVRAQCVAESLPAGAKPTYNYDRYPPVSNTVMGIGNIMAAIV